MREVREEKERGREWRELEERESVLRRGKRGAVGRREGVPRVLQNVNSIEEVGSGKEVSEQLLRSSTRRCEEERVTIKLFRVAVFSATLDRVSVCRFAARCMIRNPSHTTDWGH